MIYMICTVNFMSIEWNRHDLYHTALAHMLHLGWDLYDTAVVHMLHLGWDLYDTALAHNIPQGQA